MAPLLRLEKVCKNYPLDGVVVKAVCGAEMEVSEGDFVAIMGPSGSGKSTLMHLAGLLDSPTSGRVLLEGKDVSMLSETELAKIRNRKIGFVFQSFNLITRTSALENVMLPLIYSGVPHVLRVKKAKKILKEVGLGERFNHFPNQLSGGEQQRVAIARALVTDPKLIFADEPTGNLDTRSGDEIMKILTKLNQEGKTIILVTHEQEIADYAKRTIRVRDGKIISGGK